MIRMAAWIPCISCTCSRGWNVSLFVKRPEWMSNHRSCWTKSQIARLRRTSTSSWSSSSLNCSIRLTSSVRETRTRRRPRIKAPLARKCMQLVALEPTLRELLRKVDRTPPSTWINSISLRTTLWPIGSLCLRSELVWRTLCTRIFSPEPFPSPTCLSLSHTKRSTRSAMCRWMTSTCSDMNLTQCFSSIYSKARKAIMISYSERTHFQSARAFQSRRCTTYLRRTRKHTLAMLREVKNTKSCWTPVRRSISRLVSSRPKSQSLSRGPISLKKSEWAFLPRTSTEERRSLSLERTESRLLAPQMQLKTKRPQTKIPSILRRLSSQSRKRSKIGTVRSNKSPLNLDASYGCELSAFNIFYLKI